jgi:hypothetical protein
MQLYSTNRGELTKADVNLYVFAPLRLPNANVKATNPSLATQISLERDPAEVKLRGWSARMSALRGERKDICSCAPSAF